MSFLSKFIEKIGEAFTNIFNSAKKTWKKLSPEIQDAMLNGSRIIAVINKYREETPEFVIEMIKNKWPALPIEKLTEWLNKVAGALNIAQGLNDANLDITIKNLQQYFASVKPNGKVWATISHTAASLLSVFMAPPGTKVAAIVSLIEYVYQEFVKPDIEELEEAA